MTPITTLTLAPSLDSATTTDRMYPEGKLRCSAPVFEPGGGGINVARAIVHLGGQATALFPIGGPTGRHLAELLQAEGVDIDPVESADWTRQNLHVHVESTGEQYRFVMPGAHLTDQEFATFEHRLAALPRDSLFVISGSLPPGIGVENLQHLLKTAQSQGLRCVIDSSGPALAACLAVGNLALVKPNQKELAEMVGHSLDDPQSVKQAASDIVAHGGAERVVVSLGPQGALVADHDQTLQIVPPPVKKLSTVGAGDSMVGAMTLKLAEKADLLEMARYGVAAGSAATLHKGTRLCTRDDTLRIYQYLCQTSIL
ncbi:6-phosphofructokinase II [Martelella alba]|uniref:Phosphofructokinase n=1 Tax=Martelella alba TaxID=2590451 RepID=A0ABY2SKS7_9HYPH|nr:6-phosphofructokinase II [Martelella alba]TKI05609.1 6-phosphofructokinase II [Martelella alba]